MNTSARRSRVGLFARIIGRDRGASRTSPYELAPPLLVGQTVCERVRGLGGAGVVLEREQVELRRGFRFEDAQQACAGERGERGLIVISLGARVLREPASDDSRLRGRHLARA